MRYISTIENWLNLFFDFFYGADLSRADVTTHLPALVAIYQPTNYKNKSVIETETR